MSVVLPAPFSPSSPWISPRPSVKSTPRSAWTAPKRLAIPRISTRVACPPPTVAVIRSWRDDFVRDLGQRLAAGDLPEDRLHLGRDLGRHQADVGELEPAA